MVRSSTRGSLDAENTAKEEPARSRVFLVGPLIIYRIIMVAACVMVSKSFCQFQTETQLRTFQIKTSSSSKTQI